MATAVPAKVAWQTLGWGKLAWRAAAGNWTAVGTSDYVMGTNFAHNKNSKIQNPGASQWVPRIVEM